MPSTTPEPSPRHDSSRSRKKRRSKKEVSKDLSKTGQKKRRPKKAHSGHRVACLRVPLFPLVARLRCEPELLTEGVAILEGNGQSARVVAATRLAREAGVRVGQTLAQARALLPKLIARARDPECEHSAQEALLDVADRFSPRVEDAGEGIAYLDISGMERLFSAPSRGGHGDAIGHDSDSHLAQDLLQALERSGLRARVGIASSKLAAYVAAGLPATPQIVAAGEEAEFLAPLPLHRLAPEAEVATTLERWGISTIGHFARLPKAEISSRLGTLGKNLHQAARGLDPYPLIARTPPAEFREGLSLEWPLSNLEPFMFIARAALERLCQRLEQRGLGVKRLELSLRLEPDGYHERAIELPSPTREVKTLLTLVRLDLEAHTPGAPVIGFTFTAQPDAPKLAQLSLLGPAALSPDRLATAMARLFALLGPNRVGSPRSSSGHRPERFELVEYTPPPPPKVRPECQAGRGLLAVRVLRPPIELEVLVHNDPKAPAIYRHSTTVNEPSSSWSDIGALELQPGLYRRSSRVRPRPVAVDSTVPCDSENPGKKLSIRGKVRVASGPWELEEQWWSESPTERDYWDIELEGGDLYRIYHDRPSGRWFADGIYD